MKFAQLKDHLCRQNELGFDIDGLGGLREWSEDKEWHAQRKGENQIDIECTGACETYGGNWRSETGCSTDGRAGAGGRSDEWWGNGRPSQDVADNTNHIGDFCVTDV